MTLSRAIITLEEFGMLISDLLRSDRDVNVGVGGMTGVGKSTFGSKLQMAYSKVSGVPWDFSCMTWSRKELMGWIDGKPKTAKDENGLRENQKPEFSAILPDELFLMFYRRNWYQDGQIDSIGTFNMCRDRHLFLCGNVPNFWDLDGAFTSRLRFYVYIPQRGVAWLFEQENNPFASDPWNPGENKKIFRKHKRPDKIANFVGEIYFPDWTPEEKDEYYRIRNDKRIKAVSDDRDTRTERYGRVKEQRDKLIRVIRTQMPSITNEDLAEMLDLSKRMVEIILGTEPK